MLNAASICLFIYKSRIAIFGPIRGYTVNRFARSTCRKKKKKPRLDIRSMERTVENGIFAAIDLHLVQISWSLTISVRRLSQTAPVTPSCRLHFSLACISGWS